MPLDIRIRFGRVIRRIRRTRDQSGGGRRAVRTASDVLQRNRTRRQKRLARKSRKDFQRPKKNPRRTFSRFVRNQQATGFHSNNDLVLWSRPRRRRTLVVLAAGSFFLFGFLILLLAHFPGIL